MENFHESGIASQIRLLDADHYTANNGDAQMVMMEADCDLISCGHKELQLPGGEEELACQDVAVSAEKLVEKLQVLDAVNIQDNLHTMGQAPWEDYDKPQTSETVSIQNNLYAMGQPPWEDDVCSYQYNRIYVSPIYDGPKGVDIDTYQEMQGLKLELQRQDSEIQRLKADVERLKLLRLDEMSMTVPDSVQDKAMSPKMPMKACECECHYKSMDCFSISLQDSPCSHTESVESARLRNQLNARDCKAGRRVQSLKESMDAVKGKGLRTESGQRSSQSNSSFVVERALKLYFSFLIVFAKNVSNNILVDKPRNDVNFLKTDVGSKLDFFKKILSQLELTCQELSNKNPVVNLGNSPNQVEKLSQWLAQTEVEFNTMQSSCISSNKGKTQAVKHECPMPVQELNGGKEEQRTWVEELLSINEELLELLQAKEEKLGLLSTKVQTLRSRNKEAAEEITRLSQKVAGQQKTLRILKEDEVGLRSKNEIMKLKLACNEYELASQQLAIEKLSCREADEAGSRRSKRNESRLRQARKCLDEVEEIMLFMKAEVSKDIEGMRVMIENRSKHADANTQWIS